MFRLMRGFFRTGINPHIGPRPKEVADGDFSTQRIGDKYSTSTGVYIRNMKMLIEYLASLKE